MWRLMSRSPTSCSVSTTPCIPKSWGRRHSTRKRNHPCSIWRRRRAGGGDDVRCDGLALPANFRQSGSHHLAPIRAHSENRRSPRLVIRDHNVRLRPVHLEPVRPRLARRRANCDIIGCYQSNAADHWNWSLVVPADGKPLGHAEIFLRMRSPKSLATLGLTPLAFQENDLRELLHAAQTLDAAGEFPRSLASVSASRRRQARVVGPALTSAWRRRCDVRNRLRCSSHRGSRATFDACRWRSACRITGQRPRFPSRRLAAGLLRLAE